MNKFYIGEVRSLKDEWESGRVQVRVYGYHDDEQSIKDEDLPWATPLQPITSAATGRMGTSPTGMIVGSRVVVMFLDEEEQYPVIVGTFARAGKQKDDNDNTKGKDDIDDTYSDVPMIARGSNSDPKDPHAKVSNDNRTFDPRKKDDKYNNATHVKNDEGKELTGEAKKTSDSANLATTASISKDKASGNLMDMILQVDPQNQSGALPQAPQNIQKILQISNMTSMGGLNGLMGGGLGGILGNISNEMGIGQLLGQMSGMLGGIMNGGSSGGGGNQGNQGNQGQGGGQGSAPAGTSGPYTGGDSTQTYTYYIPQTAETISLTAVDLLTLLSSPTAATAQIAALTYDQREQLYLALLDLLNRATANTTQVTANTSANSFFVIPSEISGIQNIQYINGFPVVQVSANTTTKELPGTVVDITAVPDGYFQVFTFTSTDPYPGYIEWEGPDGELLFTVRPYNQPYSQTPNEDVINAGITVMLTDLSNLIKSKKLSIIAIQNILNNGNNQMQKQGLNNTMGNNSGNGGQQMMNIAMQLLGMLGQLLQQAQQNHIPNSVLDQGSMDQTLQNMSQQMSFIKKKKDYGKQAVEQKNQKPKKKSGVTSVGNNQFSLQFLEK